MSFAFPGSIQSFLICGSVSLSNAAQCGQVIEAYSMIVTGASLLPSTWSSGATVGTPVAAVLLLWAKAGPAAGGAASAATAATVRAYQIRRMSLSWTQLVDVRAADWLAQPPPCRPAPRAQRFDPALPSTARPSR